MFFRIGIVAVFALFVGTTVAGQPQQSFSIKTPAFSSGAMISDLEFIHTDCGGGNVSPEIRWTNVPTGTQSLVLIMEDPDAPDPLDPKLTWYHWVVFNIPPETNGIDQGAIPNGTLGRNSWRRTEYGGPCPPIGVHRYFFRLYALDTVLVELEEGALPDDVKAALNGHVLEQAETMGKYVHNQ